MITLVSGDIIERPGPYGTRHRAVFLGLSFHGPRVIHNQKDQSVREECYWVFAAGLPVSLVYRAADCSHADQIIARAQALLGQRYDLLNFNCDHLVTYAATGVPSSPQLQGTVVGLAVIALGFWAAKAAR